MATTFSSFPELATDDPLVAAIRNGDQHADQEFAGVVGTVISACVGLALWIVVVLATLSLLS